MADINKTFPSFEAALAVCGPGYSDDVIAEVIAYKTLQPINRQRLVPEQALNSIYTVGIAAAELGRRPLRVLDFGGGCGFHYVNVVDAMQMDLKWAIVESPIMAARAREVAQGRFAAFTDIAAAVDFLGGVDIVHTSGAIQYVAEPIQILAALAATLPHIFALLRFPVWLEAPVVGVHASPLSGNGLGPMPPHIADRVVQYPVVFPNFHDAMRALGGFELVLGADSPAGTYRVFGQTIFGRNLIFRGR